MTIHAVYTEGIPTSQNVTKGALVNGLAKLFVQRASVDGLFVEKASLVPWSDKGGFAITLHTTNDKVRVSGEVILLDADEAEKLTEVYRIHLDKALDTFEAFGGSRFAAFHTVEVGDEDVYYKVIIKKRQEGYADDVDNHDAESKVA